MKKKIGIGSLSLILAILAFVWSFDILGFCLGDTVLTALNLPTWSNNLHANGTHYTIFYAFIFLVPSVLLSLKYKNDFGTQVGKWLSVILTTILILGFLFMV